jgi:hypothetical protein
MMRPARKESLKQETTRSPSAPKNEKTAGPERVGRGRPSHQAIGAPVSGQSALATLLNVLVRWVPTDVTAVMMATAMRAAIKPYSMAVAPDSSEKSFVMNLRMVHDSLGEGVKSCAVFPKRALIRTDKAKPITVKRFANV